MNRQPLIGYNHNLQYKRRVYHVQTEDHGLSKPSIYTHLFFKGTVIAAVYTDYAHLIEQPEHALKLKTMMREQHKGVMKQLIQGELDAKITAILGSLEPAEDSMEILREPQPLRKIRSYHHQLQHAGRLYSIHTDYYTMVVTDLFYERILIASETQDYRDRATPGGELVTGHAQEQHKRFIRQLRDGHFNDKITRILGSLEPKQVLHRRLPHAQPQTARLWTHQVRYCDRHYIVRTCLDNVDNPRIISQLLHHRTVLTAEEHDYSAFVKSEQVPEQAYRIAQHQHKHLLKQLKDGHLDQQIIAWLGSLEPPRIKVQKRPPKISMRPSLERYHHRIRLREDVFDVVTHIFGEGDPQVQTEVFLHKTLLTTKRSRYKPVPGNDGVSEQTRLLAQEQHKDLMLQLRDGRLDDTIELFYEIEGLD